MYLNCLDKLQIGSWCIYVSLFQDGVWLALYCKSIFTIKWQTNLYSPSCRANYILKSNIWLINGFSFNSDNVNSIQFHIVFKLKYMTSIDQNQTRLVSQGSAIEIYIHLILMIHDILDLTNIWHFNQCIQSRSYYIIIISVPGSVGLICLIERVIKCDGTLVNYLLKFNHTDNWGRDITVHNNTPLNLIAP